MTALEGRSPDGLAPEGRSEDTDSLDRAAFLRRVAGRGATVAGAFALGFSIDWVWARLVRGFRLEREDYPRLVLGDLRVHHNVVGYVAILVGLFRYPAILVPLGLGMIFGHGRRDRLYWFLEQARLPSRAAGRMLAESSAEARR